MIQNKANIPKFQISGTTLEDPIYQHGKQELSDQVSWGT